MKYILLRGASHAGKSTTMDAVCRRLNPSRMQRLNVLAQTLEDIYAGDVVANGTFVLEVDGKIILVSAGSPTEQGFTITLLIEIVIRLKGKIDFALVSMRSYELKDGFDTISELELLGDCIQQVHINRLPDDYEHSAEWQGRIASILNILAVHGIGIREAVVV
jgi:hypothetical protein